MSTNFTCAQYPKLDSIGVLIDRIESKIMQIDSGVADGRLPYLIACGDGLGGIAISEDSTQVYWSSETEMKDDELMITDTYYEDGEKILVRRFFGYDEYVVSIYLSNYQTVQIQQRGNGGMLPESAQRFIQTYSNGK